MLLVKISELFILTSFLLIFTKLNLKTIFLVFSTFNYEFYPSELHTYNICRMINPNILWVKVVLGKIIFIIFKKENEHIIIEVMD